MISFLVPRDDAFTIREYLERSGRALSSQMSILHYEDLPAWQTLPSGAFILAGLDQLTPAGARMLEELCGELLRSGPGVRLLNSPVATLLRLPLLEELYRRGLNWHRAARASGDYRGLRFPVFVREEHWHSGTLSPLLKTPAELEAALARAIVRGHRLNDLLVVEFCDTADADGFFRKYAAFVVGSEIIPRHIAHARSWMVKHAGAEFTEPMVLEERAYVLENPHERELRSIFEIARTEYGRIDYSLKNGVIQTWEINTSPTIGAGARSSSARIPQELQPLRQVAKDHFYRRFQAAFEAVDAGREAARQIPIAWSPESLRPPLAMTRVQNPGRRMAAARRVLRPFRSQIDRLAGAISPVLVRIARRAR